MWRFNQVGLSSRSPSLYLHLPLSTSTQIEYPLQPHRRLLIDCAVRLNYNTSLFLLLWPWQTLFLLQLPLRWLVVNIHTHTPVHSQYFSRRATTLVRWQWRKSSCFCATLSFIRWNYYTRLIKDRWLSCLMKTAVCNCCARCDECTYTCQYTPTARGPFSVSVYLVCSWAEIKP